MRASSILSAVATAAVVRPCAANPAGECWTNPLQQANRLLVCDASLKKFGQVRAIGQYAKTPLAWIEPDDSDCIGESCVFVDAAFGGGISMISTRENAQVAADFPVEEKPPYSWPPFVEAEIPGKGRGYVANRTIRAGENIMVLTPAMIVQLGPPFGNLSFDERKPMYDKAVEKMPPDARSDFMSQYGGSINDKIDKNCFRMYLHNHDEGGDHLGCFPVAARLNHDCRPK